MSMVLAMTVAVATANPEGDDEQARRSPGVRAKARRANFRSCMTDGRNNTVASDRWKIECFQGCIAAGCAVVGRFVPAGGKRDVSGES